MRLWRVKTWVNLIIESKIMFIRTKTYNSYFTWNEKFIYANNAEEAKKKYSEYFFSPVEGGYDKDTLSIMEMYYKTRSSNMKFDLAFNEKIVHTNVRVIVLSGPVTQPIDVVRRNSTADDFRDWLVSGTYENQSIDDADWIGK